jgi:TonB family protein
VNKLLVPLAALVIGLGAATAAYHSLSKFKTETPRLAQSIPVGEIEDIAGEVSHRLPKTVQTEKLARPAALTNLEHLLTAKGAKAVVRLKGGALVRLEENSELVVELDPESKSGALIVTILSGDLSLLEAGTPGTLRLFKAGREIKPADLSRVLIPVIPTTAGAELPNGIPSESGESAPIVATTPDESAPVAAATPTGTPIGSSKEGRETKADQAAQAGKQARGAQVTDTLSNDEIRRYLKAQTAYFQRCYLTYINRYSQARPGTITVSFTIQPTGKTASARVIKSEFKDATLQKCVLDVISRTPFRPFDGEAIPVLEFPISLQ